MKSQWRPTSDLGLSPNSMMDAVNPAIRGGTTGAAGRKEEKGEKGA
jgi:hypothetical protein